MPSNHIVSFADGVFAPRRTAFIDQARALKIYDSITVHSKSTLPAQFVGQHDSLLQANIRGFGYWIWKPLIVLNALLDADADDAVIYADVGYTQNPNGRQRMLEYIEIARRSKHKMLSFLNPHTEYEWTKRDLSSRLGVDDNPCIMATSQISSGLFVLLPSESNRQLMRDWLSLALDQNYHYSDDSPSILPNDYRFREHRHDQSIGSLLRKLRGTDITHYEVQPYDWVYNMKKDALPMAATRSRE